MTVTDDKRKKEPDPRPAQPPAEPEAPSPDPVSIIIQTPTGGSGGMYTRIIMPEPKL